MTHMIHVVFRQSVHLCATGRHNQSRVSVNLSHLCVCEVFMPNVSRTGELNQDKTAVLLLVQRPIMINREVFDIH